MSISWTVPARTIPCFGPPSSDRSAGIGRNGGDQRGVLRGDDELVQVDLQPVARADGGDGPVGAVGDHRLALPVAGDHAALPPGEHRLALVGLDLEVDPARPVAGREGGVRRVPDDAAVPVQDHQPRLARPGERIPGGRQDEVRGVRGRPRALTVRDGQGGGVRSPRVTKCRTPRVSSGVAAAAGTACRGAAGRVRPRVPAQARQGQPACAEDREPAAREQLPPGQALRAVDAHLPEPPTRDRT